MNFEGVSDLYHDDASKHMFNIRVIHSLARNTKSCAFHIVQSYSSVNMASEFPPASVKKIVAEVASLLKERKETVSIAETVIF